MKNKILLLGGTGAMGKHITDLLSDNNSVFITSRSKRNSDNPNVTYLLGNAKDLSFLNSLNKQEKYDVIVDFMVYTTCELNERIDLLLSMTKQYIFISSARVYANEETPITEASPRLLDVCKDDEYLKTDEYALAKAREENILYDKKKEGLFNWTIVRPSLTYGEQRLQLGGLEKEGWLYRALKGRPIVFSEDLMEHYYTLTYGLDVAKGIVALMGQGSALGECFHIVQSKAYQWKDILNIYLSIIEEQTGKKPSVAITKKSTSFLFPYMKYQLLYGRYFDRIFDNSKINKYINTDCFLLPEEGLRNCLISFLKNPQFLSINWKLEAVNDRASGSWTNLSEIKGKKNKAWYLIYRFHLEKFMKIIKH